jgi:serum/glucocorticoid-regulated kinase 2
MGFEEDDEELRDEPMKLQSMRRLTKKEQEEHRGAEMVKRSNTIMNKMPDPKFEDFKMLMVLGRGAFGKVFLAELSQNKQLYAIKSIRKDILIELD